jgi:hypothetical protein
MIALRIGIALIGGAALAAGSARAAEIGHFNGGVMNIRDYLVPEPGWYAAAYNYFFRTDRINDSDGHEIASVTIDPPGGAPGVTLGVDVDVDMYALAPSLIWVTDVERLGLRYAALITPTFANFNLNAGLSTANQRGGTVEAHAFGVGDLFVQPLWLGLPLEHWDFALAYGFYAPIGRYSTQTTTLPIVGAVEVEASDNIGYGFWTHQLQASAAWYPMDDKGTALDTALTYETNGRKEDFDLTPGDNLTLNWGLSQFLPLRNDMSLLLEIGPAGYDAWQISDGSGSEAGGTRDQVHAVGGQIGLSYVPWMVSLNVHGFYEFAARNRFQGGAFGIDIAKGF